MVPGISIERLYELAEILDNAKDKIGEHEKEYTEILSGKSGGVGEKKLTSSFIVRYFHQFPNLRDQSLDVVFELCEDDDVMTRKVVIKDLPSLCKDAGPHVSKVADVLTQLLQAEDTQEHMLVTTALTGILKKFPKETLVTIFGHILNAEEELIRDRAVKFLALKIRLLPSSLMTNELENFIIEESKKVLQDVTGEEFVLFIHILSSLSQLQTVSGRQKLLELITEQADLDKSYDPKDSDRVDQICQCIKQAIPYLSKNVPSTNFVEFLLVHVVSSLDELTMEGSETVKLEILRTLADLSPHCGELKDYDSKLTPLFQRLIECLPLPPSESGEGGDGGEPDKEVEEKIKFSETESLLWAMHQLGKKHPGFYTNDSRSDDMKELRKRLQYAARMIQVYSKKLREHLQKKTKDEIAKEEKVKVIALRTTANITTLIRDMLHQPPSAKASIAPSWRPNPESKSAPVRNGSRDDEDESPARKSARKEGLSVYRPPGGKFSEKAGAYSDSGNGYGGGLRQGGWRRGGGSRGWNRGGGGYRY